MQSISFRGAVLFNARLQKKPKNGSSSIDNSLGRPHPNEDKYSGKQSLTHSNCAETTDFSGEESMDEEMKAAVREAVQNRVQAEQRFKWIADWERAQNYTSTENPKEMPTGKLRKYRKPS